MNTFVPLKSPVTSARRSLAQCLELRSTPSVGMRITTILGCVPFAYWPPFATGTFIGTDPAWTAGGDIGTVYNTYTLKASWSGWDGGWSPGGPQEGPGTCSQIQTASSQWVNGFGRAPITTSIVATGFAPTTVYAVPPGFTASGGVIFTPLGFSQNYADAGGHTMTISVGLTGPVLYATFAAQSLALLSGQTFPPFLPPNPYASPSGPNTGSDNLLVVYPDASGGTSVLTLNYALNNPATGGSPYLLACSSGKFFPLWNGAPYTILWGGTAGIIDAAIPAGCLISSTSQWNVGTVNYFFPQHPSGGFDSTPPITEYLNPFIPTASLTQQTVSATGNSYVSQVVTFDPSLRFSSGSYGEIGFQANSF